MNHSTFNFQLGFGQPRLDVNLISAHSGPEAIELFEKNEISVILMDVMMPGMDGIETAKKIRQLEKGKYTPLIFVTAHPLDQMRTLQGYGIGAIDSIQKPIAEDILRSKVQVFIDLERHQEELQEFRIREMRIRFEAEALRKQLEKEREIAEIAASYRLFVDSVKDYAIFLVSPDGKIQSWNPGVRRILGYDKDEILGLDFSCIFNNEDIQRGVPRRELENALAYDRAEDTRWHVRKNGALFWADGVVVSLRENGEIKGFAKLLRDRTESKLAEEALLVSEERLRLATEATNLGTWDWNLITGQLKWSDRTRALCGLGQGVEINYETFLSTVHPEDRKHVEASIERAKSPASNGEYRVEYRALLEDGSERWLSVRGKVFFDDSQQPIRMLGTCWDISDRKRMEQELRRSNEDLERFAHLASHDLQEPLRMVTSFLHLLEKRMRGSLDAESLGFLNFAVDGASRMKSLIEELLAYSRVGSHLLQLKPVESRQVLEEVATNLRCATEESGAKVSFEMLPQVRGDHVQLVQLFQNLIQNAIKYHGEEAPRINVGASERDGEFLFFVQDNGIGIPMEYAPRLFDPFFRLQGKDHRSGSGLGLSVCKRIVERHGGRIWFESIPGKGSTFFFTLPQPNWNRHQQRLFGANHS